jgi:endonuclease YncB( thermonuclease family)
MLSPSEISQLVNNSIPFVPQLTEGIVVKVYDGDTITIVSKLPYDSSPLYKFSVRINNIDCPEIKGSKDDEKQCAKIAKQRVSDLILNRKIELCNIGTEKYGRVLADVVIDGQDIGTMLVNERLAFRYNGGTKKRPVSWLKYYQSGEME